MSNTNDIFQVDYLKTEDRKSPERKPPEQRRHSPDEENQAACRHDNS